MAADGSIVIEAKVDIKQAQNKLNKLEQDAQKTAKSIQEMENQKAPLVEEAERLKQALKEARAEIEAAKKAWLDGVLGADREMSAAEEKAAAINAQYQNVVGQIVKIDSKLGPAYDKMDKIDKDTADTARELTTAKAQMDGVAESGERAQGAMAKFSHRVAGLVRRVFVFSVITSALRSVRSWLGEVIKKNDEASAATNRLSAAFQALVQPILNAVLPVFIQLVDLLTSVVVVIGRIIAAIFGTTYDNSVKAAKGLNEEAKAIGGVGTAAKKAERYLASFDEINQIGSNDSGGSSGGAGGVGSNAGLLKAFDDLAKKELDVELILRNLRTSWEEGKIAQNRDAWILALSTFLGAVLGTMFGGITGGILGVLLGATIGLKLIDFANKSENPDEMKSLFIVVLAGILGAVIGARFLGLTGGVIGLMLGLGIGLSAVKFIELAEAGKWDQNDTWNTVLLAILGAVIGGIFGGVKGAVIGLVMGIAVSVIAADFINKLEHPEMAKAIFRMVLIAILAAVIGGIFGGAPGAVIGLVMGLGIGFLTVEFDKKLSAGAKAAAERVFKIALTAILGAIIGAAFGGLFGGVIGLTLGLAIGIGSVDFDDSAITGIRKGGGGYTSGTNSGGLLSRAQAIDQASSVLASNTPRLAQGAVIPPNREFMAVLGDQPSGTNIETPLETMVQAFRMALAEGGMGRDITVIMELDRTQFGKVVYRANTDEVQRVGVKLAEVR